MSFNELRLAEPIVRAVAEEGYTNPTPIQTKAIPAILAGNDVLGCAQTGTGKTGAFAMPILQRLAESSPDHGVRSSKGPGGKHSGCKNSGGGRPRALVLCPTRELATQIFESFRAYGRHLPLRHAVVFGGVNQAGQVRALRSAVDVLVATPGRLLDLIGQGLIDLRGIEVFVLDEADRMFDMGFIRDIRKVVDLIPPQRQTLLFSATMPAEIRLLAESILCDPISVQVAPQSTTADAITQSIYMVTRQNKPVLLARLLRHGGMERTLVFTRTKHGADKLVKTLRASGIDAGAIHGNKTQNARTRALDDFKSGGMPVLVATDIASRGIDVDEITHVVNFDLPSEPETYVHRIGRTARAGSSGAAVSFCDYEECGNLRAIERLLGISIDVSAGHDDLVFDPRAPERQRSRNAPPEKTGGAARRRKPRRSRGGGPERSRVAGAAGGSRVYSAGRRRQRRSVAR